MSGSSDQRIPEKRGALHSAKNDQNSPNKRPKGGLGAEIHPLLRDLVSLPTASANKNRKNITPRDKFDAASLNPYLNQSDIGSASHIQRRRKPFQLNPKGTYVAKANQIREEEEKSRQKELERQSKSDKGLLPDDNIREDAYQPRYPPLIEWWDRPYLHTRLYDDFNKKDYILDDEEAPVTLYVQHPVPIKEWKLAVDGEPPMFLTKKEMKRKRRNERQIRHKEKQDRIRLGLDPPPPPKVKLSNLMNVLTNEAIQDPTGVEIKVRKEVEAREKEHMRVNEERKLTPEQRHEKIKNKHEKDLSQGFYTNVYRVADLSDPQQYYKVDINAKQMDLCGIILKNPRFCLVIAEGGAKGLKFYNKLMTRRIKWTQPVLESTKDLSGNKCELIWEGQLKALNFKKWSTMYSANDEDALTILLKFGVENYWREACNVTNT